MHLALQEFRPNSIDRSGTPTGSTHISPDRPNWASPQISSGPRAHCTPRGRLTAATVFGNPNSQQIFVWVAPHRFPGKPHKFRANFRRLVNSRFGWPPSPPPISWQPRRPSAKERISDNLSKTMFACQFANRRGTILWRTQCFWQIRGIWHLDRFLTIPLFVDPTGFPHPTPMSVHSTESG